MRSTNYKNYLLITLTVIYAFNYVDRLALAIVLQDIKLDLHLTDTQLGFLGGIAFALFYSLMGVPIARWADRGNRVLIIALSTASWSVAVALCGVAATFTQLLLIRVAVAIGEAGCVPPSLSLLADYFKRSERPWAAAIHALGPPLSAVLGFYLAGLLNELYGWRMTFVLLGAPGILLGVLAGLTLREPRCATGSWRVPQLPSSPASPSLKTVFAALWPRPTFRHLLACVVINYFFGAGITHWLPAFMGRSHGLSSTQIGLGLAIAVAVSAVGTYLGGMLASRYAPNDEPRQLRAVAVSIVAASILSAFTYICPDAISTFAVMALFMFGIQASNGPVLGAVQTLIPDHMRATAFALIYLVANLVGGGLGPLAAGALSDALRPWAGDESLRYALVILSPGFFLSAWHIRRASKMITRDMAILQTGAQQRA